MTGRSVTRFHGAAHGWVAGMIVGVIGVLTVVTLAAVARSELATAAAGGAAIGVAFLVLLAAGWADGLYVLILAIPLPAAFTADARLTLVAPITAAVVFGWFVNWGVDRRPLRLGDLPRRSVALLLAAFAIAVLFANARLLAVREFINIAVLVALFVAATELFTGRPSRVRAVINLLVAVAAVCGMLALLEAVQLLPGQFPRWETPFNRAALGFGQPNALGLFLAVTLPLSVYKLVTARSIPQRVVGATATLLVALGLLGTFSRGSWLAVLAGGGVLAFAKAGRWTVRIWAVALIGAVVTDVASGGVLTDTVRRTVGDWVLEQRAVLVLVGVLMFVDNPFFGVGPGGFAEQVENYAARIPQLWDLQPTPHNAYIQMAAETGAIGLVALIVFFAALSMVALRRARAASDDSAVSAEERSLRLALLWSVATVVLAGLVVWPFSHGAGQAVVLIAALAVAGTGRATHASAVRTR